MILVIAALALGHTISWRYERPKVDPVLDIPTIRLHEVHFANDATMVVAPRPGKLANVRLAWKASATTSDAATVATAWLMFKDKRWHPLTDVGASLSFATTDDGAWIQVTVPSELTNRAIAVLTTLVRQPRCAAKDLSILADRLEAVPSDAQIGEDLLFESMGGTPSRVFRDDLRKIDCAAIPRDELSPEHMLVVVVGDVDVAAVEAQVERGFGKLVVGRYSETRGSKPVERRQPRTQLIDRPGASQTIILAGRFALEHPPRLGVESLGYVAGHVTWSLRSWEPLAYGVDVNISKRALGLTLNVATTVPRHKTKTAMALFARAFRDARERVAKNASEPVFSYRRRLAQSLLTRVQTIDGLAHEISAPFLRGAPCGSVTYAIDDIRDADIPAAQAWAAEELDPEDLHFVIIGDAAVVREAVRDAGLRLDE